MDDAPHPHRPGHRLREEELKERFACASGPGGQHAQTVETAVQMRFDAENSTSLPEPARAWLLRLAGHRPSGEGLIVNAADRFRSRARNRADACARLIALIAEVAEPLPLPPRGARPRARSSAGWPERPAGAQRNACAARRRTRSAAGIRPRPCAGAEKSPFAVCASAQARLVCP
jgi:ribosome-associated protein